jgi:hypothetical protein
MKNVLWVVLILAATAARAEKGKPNPAEYTVDIQVQSSRMEPVCDDVTNVTHTCYWMQDLGVTLAGKRFDLRGNLMPKNPYVLKLGDYKAKVVKEDNTKSYGYSVSYQVLFPDGAVAEYEVVGISQ